jgi:hypothetical protein
MSPHFGVDSFETGEMYKYPTKCSEVTRIPLLVARAKSELEVKRASVGSTKRSVALLSLTQRALNGPWRDELKGLHGLHG